MPTVSIIAASIDSPDWAELLVKSVRKFTAVDYEIIIIDNGSLPENLEWLRKQKDIRLIEMRMNAGHGAALDTGLSLASSRYVCSIDIDAHFQRPEWVRDLIGLYHSRPGIRLVGCRGPEHKPLKPPLFFFERQFFLENRLSFRYVPGVSTDTAQKIYWDILDLGLEVERLVPEMHVYGCEGDEFWVDGLPTFYHSWYGTRFNERHPQRRKDELDGYKLKDYLANKAKLFNECLVKEILAYP